MGLKVPVTYTGVEAEICTDLLRCIAGDTFRNFTFRIIQVTKKHGAAPGVRARFHARRLAVGIDTVNTQGAAFYRAFAPRCMGFLVFQGFMHK